MINEVQFQQLLKKYGTGKCSEQEIAELDAYIEYLNHKHITEGEEQSSEDRISGTLHCINRIIDDYEVKRNSRKANTKVFMRVAASLLLILSVSFIFFQNKSRIENALHPVKYFTVTSGKAQHVDATLPDGSEVVLNERSKLVYSNRFNDTLREVSLDGEAYFRVTKNKHKPFIVLTGNIRTRVLGTSFNVQAYPGSHHIQVALITGKVWVSSSPSLITKYILTPNQTFIYNKLTGQAQKTEVQDANNYIAWQTGKISFMNTPLDEVVNRINAAFGTAITVENKKVAACRIFGVFNTNDQPQDIVRAICVLAKSTYVLKPDGAIVIAGKSIYGSTPQNKKHAMN